MYTLAPDIESALQDVMGRTNERYRKSPRPGSVDEAALREDEGRIGLLQALARLSRDPNRRASLDAGVTAQMDLARQQADDQAGSVRGAVVQDAAARGLLGGSSVASAKGRIGAARDQAVRTAATGADDWRTGIQQGDQEYLSGILASILAPTGESDSAMQAQLQGYSTNLALGDQLQQVREQQNQILAQTLGGITSGLTNTLIAGSQVHRDRNAQRREDGLPRLSIWQSMTGGG